MSSAYIPLSKGLWATIDEADCAAVEAHRWHAAVGGKYAATTIDGRYVFLHRFLMGEPDSLIDHINGSGLDNRRANLRLATPEQNAWNTRPRTDRFFPRGVTPMGGSFVARIRRAGAERYLGTYKTPEEAGAAYRKAALEREAV